MLSFANHRRLAVFLLLLWVSSMAVVYRAMHLTDLSRRSGAPAPPLSRPGEVPKRLLGSRASVVHMTDEYTGGNATEAFLMRRAVCHPPPFRGPKEKRPKWQALMQAVQGPPAAIVDLTSGSLGVRLRALVAAQTLGIAVGRGVYMVWSRRGGGCGLPFREEVGTRVGRRRLQLWHDASDATPATRRQRH